VTKSRYRCTKTSDNADTLCKIRSPAIAKSRFIDMKKYKNIGLFQEDLHTKAELINQRYQEQGFGLPDTPFPRK